MRENRCRPDEHKMKVINIKGDKKGSFFKLLSIWAYVVLLSLNSLVASVQYVIVMALHRAQVREPKKSASRS